MVGRERNAVERRQLLLIRAETTALLSITGNPEERLEKQNPFPSCIADILIVTAEEVSGREVHVWLKKEDPFSGLE